MARDSDRGVRPQSSGGHFESSIYPVEHVARVLQVGWTDLGAKRIGPRMTMAGNVFVRDHSPLHERVDDALHALSREPEIAPRSGLVLDR